MKHWTGEEIRRAIELSTELLTPAEIAECLDRPVTMVRRKLRDHAMPRVDRRGARRNDANPYYTLRKPLAKALEPHAKRYTGGSVRKLVATIIEAMAEHPRLVDLAMKAPMDRRSP